MIHTRRTLSRDTLWLIVWLSGIAALAVWDTLFLNRPALKLLIGGFVNTFCVALMVIVVTLALGWATTILLHSLEKRKSRIGYLIATFVLNLVRSVPQVVGILIGYVWIAFMIQDGTLRNQFAVFTVMACCMSLFIFLELVDLMRELES